MVFTAKRIAIFHKNTIIIMIFKDNFIFTDILTILKKEKKRITFVVEFNGGKKDVNFTDKLTGFNVYRLLHLITLNRLSDQRRY
jgi:hypothetical protein